jgi:hypothetical protein
VSLIGLLIILLVFGLVIYIVDVLIPDPMIKNVVRAVLAVILVLYLLQIFIGGGPVVFAPSVRGPVH